MENCEVKIRNEFFISALFVENTISTFLSEKLELQELVNSNSFGNTSYALKFDQKIELLLETANFSIIDKSKISVFREIHNEFVLNKDKCSIEECFTSEDSNDDFLLILYPQSEFIPREEKIINACYQLIGEVSELISNTTNKPEVKMKRRSSFLRIDTSSLSKLTFLFSFLFLR